MPTDHFRMRMILAVILKLIAGPIQVTGIENIEIAKKLLTPKEGVRPALIIASSHLSNLDMLAAISVLSRFFTLCIINKSLHYSLIHRPVERICMSVAGAKTFLPISYHVEDEYIGKGRRISREYPKFIPKDFRLMAQALQNGEVVMIAAHNPSIDWKLPTKAGYGAVYLGELVQPSFIMPLTVNVESDTPVGIIDILPEGTVWQKIKAFFHRPAISIHIHPPLPAQPLPKVARFQELAERHDTLTSFEKVEFEHLREFRRAEGEKIMNIIASRLPRNKRGSRLI